MKSTFIKTKKKKQFLDGVKRNFAQEIKTNSISSSNKLKSSNLHYYHIDQGSANKDKKKKDDENVPQLMEQV